MPGYTIDRTALNNEWGNLALSLNVTFENIRQAKKRLDGLTAADFSAMGASADEAIIRSAATDMAKLLAVYEGSQTQTPAYDFRTFLQQLWRWGH